MAHIRLPEGIPGILGPMAFSQETAKLPNELAEVLLRGRQGSEIPRLSKIRMNSRRVLNPVSGPSLT
jgi:hypothetical protein